MNKIEEIIDKHDATTYYGCLSRGNWNENIILMMKEYAEYYAIKCLQLAAKSVKSEQVMNIQQGYEPFAETRIDKGSILNIKLPEHE